MGNINFEFKELGKLGKSIIVQEMLGNDTKYLRLTKLYKDTEGNWHPTNKGISVPITEIMNLRSIIDNFIKSNKSMIGENPIETPLTSDINDL